MLASSFCFKFFQEDSFFAPFLMLFPYLGFQAMPWMFSCLDTVSGMEEKKHMEKKCKLHKKEKSHFSAMCLEFEVVARKNGKIAFPLMRRSERLLIYFIYYNLNKIYNANLMN